MDRPPRKIRLAIFDFDNTLVGPDITPSPRVREAIRRAHHAGLHVTIATGRGPNPVAARVEPLGLRTPVIYMQGGLIYDHLAGATLLETRLPADGMERVLQAAERHRWNLILSYPEHLFLTHRLAYDPAVLEQLARYQVEWMEEDPVVLAAPPYKFMAAVGKPSQRDALAAEMRSAFPPGESGFDIVPSHPLLVEGVPAGVHKGRAAEWLSRRMGIAREETMTVGDNDNDVEMLTWAGWGVAMGGSSPAARAAAKAEVPSVEEDGAAVAIERWMLGE